MNEKNYSTGDVICREGEAGGTLYVIMKGRVLVEKKAFEEEKKTKAVARLGVGDFFGEMAFLQGLPHSATVTAEEDTQLFLLSRSSLDELIQKSPSTAIEELMKVAMGLSTRLRATTRELVTVYQVARAVATSSSVEDVARRVIGQLRLDLGDSASVGFYRWNMFNDEYMLVVAEGAAVEQFPAVLEADGGVFQKEIDRCVPSRIDMLGRRQGLIVYTSGERRFDAGEKQMMETVASVLAPALATAGHREEEESRRRLERNKQMGASL